MLRSLPLLQCLNIALGRPDRLRDPDILSFVFFFCPTRAGLFRVWKELIGYESHKGFRWTKEGGRQEKHGTEGAHMLQDFRHFLLCSRSGVTTPLLLGIITRYGPPSNTFQPSERPPGFFLEHVFWTLQRYQCFTTQNFYFTSESYKACYKSDTTTRPYLSHNINLVSAF